MTCLPKRTTLASETASVVKRWVESGILKDVLPSEAQLKARLGVGRDTLRQALKLLEDEGWVTGTSRGHRRQVRDPAQRNSPETAVEKLPVSFLSPFGEVDRIALLEMEDLQKLLSNQGRFLQFVSPNIFRLKDPARLLARLVDEQPSAAWILYQAGERVQRWFDRQRIPAFIYGSPFPGVSLPYVENDWESAGYHAGLQFLRFRHRTVGILQRVDSSPGTQAMERGLEKALGAATPRAQLLSFECRLDGDSMVSALEAAFALKTRPTALLLIGSPQLPTVLSWLVSKGIRVPADLSLICPPSDTWFEDLRPSICYYRCNSKVFARHVSLRVGELVAAGSVSRKSIRLPVSYVPGASIGPAPGA